MPFCLIYCLLLRSRDLEAQSNADMRPRLEKISATATTARTIEKQAAPKELKDYNPRYTI